MGFLCGSAGKESASNVGDLGLIPGLGKSPGEGKGYPLQYSGLENSMDCIGHGVTESDMTVQLSLTHSLTKTLSNYNFSFSGDVLERVTPQSCTFKLINLGKQTKLYSVGWKCL